MPQLLIIISLFITSCVPNESSQLQFVEVKSSDFQKYINQVNFQDAHKLNQSEIIKLYSDGPPYKLEFILYRDGIWTYHLPSLDDGTGSWAFEENSIKLFAKRPLFDMNIKLHAIKNQAKEIAIEFFDRFGFQSAKLSRNPEL